MRLLDVDMVFAGGTRAKQKTGPNAAAEPRPWGAAQRASGINVGASLSSVSTGSVTRISVA